MNWTARLIVFTLIPVILLIVLAPDQWGWAEYLTIFGANVLGYAEGLISEAS